MDSIRRIAGMGKAKVPSAVQMDKDESIVFFRELYKRDKDKDIDLLEPMYSVEFDAIQVENPTEIASKVDKLISVFCSSESEYVIGGQTSKAPSRKKDFLIAVDEKHDYDWLKTPPATPLFPSIEMETNSSQMVFQKELPIPRPVKTSASRFSGKTEATKTSVVRSMLPKPDCSSKRSNLSRGAASTISSEKNQPCTIEKRSNYAAVTSRKQKPVTATAPTAPTADGNGTKKHSDRCYASQGAPKRVINPQVPCNAPKNLITTGSILTRQSPSTAKSRIRDSALGVDDKVNSSRTRKQSCTPVATRGIKEQIIDGKQKGLQDKVKAVTVSNEPASSNRGRAAEATLMKGMRRTDGKNEQRPNFFDNQAKK